MLGSGRTEILETLFGSANGRSGGEVTAARVSPSTSARHATHAGWALALVTEDRKTQGLHLEASITDNVALPLVSRLARFGLRSFGGERIDCARGACSSLDIRCSSIDQAAGRLSGGNQQKVVIGKWLATRPRVLLLDEPTRGIDVGAKREIYDLVFKLARDDGLAIVVVSSELPELLLLSDRILVMSEGRQRGILRARGRKRRAHHAARRAAVRRRVAA